MPLLPLTTGCLLLTMLRYRRGSNSEATTQAVPQGFAAFQSKYISVYLVIMLADWLQGTNMWTLYDSYGVDIGTLFLTGFVSSAVFSASPNPRLLTPFSTAILRFLSLHIIQRAEAS